MSMDPVNHPSHYTSDLEDLKTNYAEGQQRGWMDAMESVQADTEVSRALSGVSPNPYESEES